MEKRICFIIFVWSIFTLNGVLGAPSIVTSTTTEPTTDKLDDTDLVASVDKVDSDFNSETNNLDEMSRRSDLEQEIENSPRINSRVAKLIEYPVNTVESNSDINPTLTPIYNSNMPSRQDKMMGYFGYYPQPTLTPLGAYPSMSPYFQQEYLDYASSINEEEDIMSRANRRRPQSSNSIENSPIFYIRLPPTPYMFVPGFGYISNPPSITPLTTFAPNPQQHIPSYNPQSLQNPYAQQPNPYSHQPNPYVQPINPFINLPLNFVSNGKPTNVYQWNGAPAGYQPQPNPYQLGYPMQGMQQMQSRPQQRPHYKPKPSYLQDSKIHHLKGQYLFNGRPEEVFLLQQNSYNSLGYTNPMRHYY